MVETASQVAEIVQSVFDCMLSLQVARCAEPWISAAGRITASVHLSGAWSGSVELECSADQAREFTHRFLASSGSAGATRSDDVVSDLLGELANMIGGNWKCVLGRGIQLSAPQVGPARTASPSTKLEQLAFRCSEGVFWVTIFPG